MSITAQKAGTMQQEMSTPGIYYMLPKTEVHVGIPALLDQLQAGRVGRIYEDCLASCNKKAHAEPDSSKACALPSATTLRLLRPQITLRGVPDPGQLYYVTASSEMFSSVKHQIGFSDSGVVTELSSSGTNLTYEVAAGVFDKVLDIVAIGKLAAPAPKTVRPNGAREAPRFPEDMARLSCKDAQKIFSDLDGFRRDIEKEIATLDTWLSAGKKQPVGAEFAKLIIARTAERVAAIREQLAKYRADADLDSVKKSYRYQLSFIEPLVAPEFQSIARTRLELKAGAPADEAEAQAPSLLKIISDANLTIHASLSHEAKIPPCSNCASGSSAGYRYRIPATGKLVIEVETPGTPSGPRTSRQLFADHIPIAQYGPVAALPQRFEGKGGSVEISLSPVTGALRKVAIGTEALPASAVTAPLEAVRGAEEDRQKRKAEAAKEAASADKTALERERDLLKLQKEIRDLKQELGQ